MDAHYQGNRGRLSREARNCREVERLAERKTGYIVLSGLSGDVALAEALRRSMMGSRRMNAVVQVAMIDSGSTVAVLVARRSQVEVHILSPPFHLPFELLLVRMPLTAEDWLHVSNVVFVPRNCQSNANPECCRCICGSLGCILNANGMLCLLCCA